MEAKAEEQNAHLRLSEELEELDSLNKQKEAVENEIADTELGKTEKLIEQNPAVTASFVQDRQKGDILAPGENSRMLQKSFYLNSVKRIYLSLIRLFCVLPVLGAVISAINFSSSCFVEQ